MANRDPDCVDHISRLPDEILSDIVSRLTVKDAARTSVLAARWRGVWLTAPLALVDVHLTDHREPTLEDTPAIVAAVSRVLEAHQGPFRCFKLLCCYMGAHQAQLARWLALLAAKGVQELHLTNNPFPSEVPLPETLFRIATVTRLRLTVWKFPDAAGLQGACFPHLRELDIYSVLFSNGDLDSVVARSPVLDILNLQGNLTGLRLRLVSNSLRCVQINMSVMESIAVVRAPRLERLILSRTLPVLPPTLPVVPGSYCIRIKIGHAPKLRLFGYLEPGHVLEIQGTTITPGLKSSTSTMVTSVKVLSLKLRFGICNDARIVPTFLRCFPNVEALHIVSLSDEPTLKINHNLWKAAGFTQSVMAHIKVMTFAEFRGERGELAFLQLFLDAAPVLKNLVIVMANPSFTSLSVNEMSSRAMSLKTKKRHVNIALVGSKGPEGGHAWETERGANFSDDDPFAPVKVQTVPAKKKTAGTGKSGAGKRRT